jgi:hypothetical protein
VLEGHHIWFLRRSNRLLLAEWPNAAEENSISDLMQLAKMDSLEQIRAYERYSDDTLQDEIIQLINKCSVPAHFESLQLQPDIVAHLMRQNEVRTKQHPWRWDHLLPTFEGSFYKWQATDPIMRKDDVKRFLAALVVLTNRMDGSRL